MGWGLFAIFCWGTLAAAAGSALERTHPAWVLGGAFSAAALVFAFLPRLFGLEGIAEPREAGKKWRGKALRPGFPARRRTGPVGGRFRKPGRDQGNDTAAEHSK